MPRVVPSLVARTVKQMYPFVADQPDAEPNFNRTALPSFAAVVRLVDAIPSDLLRLSPEQYIELNAGVACLRGAADLLQGSQALPLKLNNFRKHPLTLIYESLVACEDEVAMDETPFLPFIEERAFAETLRLDLSTAHKALGNGEWKAATVLAGSIIEALLLWHLERHDDEHVTRAMNEAVAKGHQEPRRGGLARWHLPDYIAAAAQLKCIRPGTVQEAKRTQEYRNLIHPGAVIRTQQECGLGTAHIAVGTVDHVIRDLGDHTVHAWA